MRITKFGHACVRIEHDGTTVVLDPGGFTDVEAVDGADAVLITHEHPDHLDLTALTDAVASRPGLRIFAHQDVLRKLGGCAERTTTVQPGREFSAAGFRVRAYGGRHAVIHPDIPVIANLAYLIDDGRANLYHPGDSFTVPEDAAVDTLFVPLNAPWMRLMESIDFARAVKPGRAFATHDHLLTDDGAKISDGHLERLSGTKYAHVAPGTVLA